MYGLEKKSPAPAPFEFDLEQSLKQDPEKAKAILKMVETKVTELKNLIKKGAAPNEVEDANVLLLAYTGLQRVLNRITNKK